MKKVKNTAMNEKKNSFIWKVAVIFIAIFLFLLGVIEITTDCELLSEVSSEILAELVSRGVLKGKNNKKKKAKESNFMEA